MKHILGVFLIICLLFSIAGCDGTTSSTVPTQSESIVTAPLPEQQNPYADILNALVEAYPWNDSDTDLVPQYPELSYMYRRYENLSDIGYALADVDGNGQEELILTSMDNPFVFDLFTVQDGKVVQIFSSGERYSHILYKDGIVIEHWSGSAFLSGNDFFQLQDDKLVLIERVTYDAEYAAETGVIPSLNDATSENAYFYSTSQDKADYRHISIEEMRDISAKYDAVAPLDYTLTPLSEYNA